MNYEQAGMQTLNKQETLPIIDVEHVEIWSGNAKQSAFFYSKLFGFDIIGYSGLETGNRDTVSYMLQQGEIRLIITGSYSQSTEVADFINKHGDAVKDIALRVEDLAQTWEHVVASGATIVRTPYEEQDEFGVVKKAVIQAFGDTVHTLVERKEYHHPLQPGFMTVEGPRDSRNAGLTRLDHVAINVESAAEWSAYYAKILGFTELKEFKAKDVSSSKSSLMTKAMQNGTERIKIPIVEPAPGEKKSQITEFLEYNGGAGVQHLAFLTDDIIQAVDCLQANGVQFLFTPDAYYEMLPGRVGSIDEPIEELNRLNILVDRDEEGYLLQIFGQPVQDRPTMFVEIIQRKGSNGFGNGNIRALFESVEREQEKRGNL